MSSPSDENTRLARDGLVVGERAPAVGQVLLELFVTPVPKSGAERAADEEEQDEEADEGEALALFRLLFCPLQLACLVGDWTQS